MPKHLSQFFSLICTLHSFLVVALEIPLRVLCLLFLTAPDFHYPFVNVDLGFSVLKSFAGFALDSVPLLSISEVHDNRF